MNVLSLPDEMLASVLKYKNSEDLTKLRKVSSKIDSVARRYGLDKWKIDSLAINYFNTYASVVIQFTIHITQVRPSPSMDLLEILKYYFSKTRGAKELAIIKRRSEQNTSISNEVGEFLCGNRCKNITKLTIVGWEISINFNIMRKIMTKLNLKELYIRSSLTEFEFSDAVIEGISFDCLQLINRKFYPMKLSLPYLARLCALKIPSTLTCAINNSTVTDLLEFFKLWTKDMLRKVVNWTIVIPKGKMSVDETKQYISNLKCFEDCEVTKRSKGRRDTIIYSIEIGKISSYSFNTQSILICSL